MRMRFDPTRSGDEAAFAETCDLLLEEFDEWLDENREGDASEPVADAQTFIDWRFYYSTGVLDDYSDDDLTEFLLGWLPRKVVASPEDAGAMCHSVGTFIEFLTRTGRLVGGADRGARLITHANDLAAEVVLAMGDPSNFGMGKSLFAGMGADLPEFGSVDDLEAALQAKMEEFNALPFEERKALTDPFLTAPEPEPVELPFVHIPPPIAAIEESAAAAPILAKVERLRDYLGEGKQLTQTGNLKLVDGEALVGVLETGDRFNAQIGDRTFKTQSTADLPGLRLLVETAEVAQAVRVNKGRLVPVKAWANKSPLDQATAAFEALMTIGPLWARRSRSFPYHDALDEFLEDGIAPILSPLLATGTDCPFEVIVEHTQDVVREQFELHYPMWAQYGADRSVARTTSILYDTLMMAGLIEWTDRQEVITEFGLTETTGSSVRLTPFAHHVLPGRLRDAGYVVRGVGDLSEASAEFLFEAFEIANVEDLPALVDAWQPHRTADARIEMVVRAIGESGSSRVRLAGFGILEGFPPESVGPYVRQLLDSPAAGHAAMWLAAHGLIDDEVAAQFANIGTWIDLLATSLDDPDELCDLFMAVPTFEDAAGVLDQMWRHPAPETAEVLDVLGHHLPDKKLAKAARKAAIQHRTHMANQQSPD